MTSCLQRIGFQGSKGGPLEPQNEISVTLVEYTCKMYSL